MSIYNNHYDIQEEEKIQSTCIDEQIQSSSKKSTSQQLISSNYIKISKGQKNAFVQNFEGIKSVELKQQVQAKHLDDAFCLCILDNMYLAVGSNDATITIYNLKNNCKLVRKINYFYEPIIVLEPLRLFHKTLLLSSGFDQIINVWDYLSGKKIIDLESCGCEVTKLCDNLDKNLIVGSTFDGRIILWSYVNKKIVEVLKLQSSLNKDKLVRGQSQQQQENIQDNEDEEFQEITMDSEMDLESHGQIYSLHQINCDQYLVLQRGCISEIKIIKTFENEKCVEEINDKNQPTELLTEEYDQDIQIKKTRKNSIVKITNYQIQVLRQFESNQDAVQFNVVPYENQQIITLGTKRGYVYLIDYDTGAQITQNQTHHGAVNEILTIQSLENKYDNPFIISSSHEDRYLKVESLKTGDALKIEDNKIYCYNECMNSKMQFFKNKKNELFVAVICQEHLNPYFSIFQINFDYSIEQEKPKQI